jgi:glyoxylase-like metal-dependent hydrolase (beta-lactamase superfamily II)
VFLFAGDVSYTEQLMLDGVVDGVTADPAASRTTLARVRQLVSDRPTVYLPTHDPAAIERLTQGRPAGLRPVRVPA